MEFFVIIISFNSHVFYLFPMLKQKGSVVIGTGMEWGGSLIMSRFVYQMTDTIND